MRVRDVMTREVVTVNHTTPLKDVAQLMIERGISGLPVVDDDAHLVGVISEADFLMKERGDEHLRHRPLSWLLGEPERNRRIAQRVHAQTAGEAMSAPPVTIGPDALLSVAADLMLEKGFNRLPVTTGGSVVGIVTRADLMKAYVRSDAELERTIRDDLLGRTLWIEPGSVEVKVAKGVVHLAGTVERRSVAELIPKVVADVGGVVAVEGEISFRFDDLAEPEFEPPLRLI
jgi:CBS domain-containing protein